MRHVIFLKGWFNGPMILYKLKRVFPSRISRDKVSENRRGNIGGYTVLLTVVSLF